MKRISDATTAALGIVIAISSIVLGTYAGITHIRMKDLERKEWEDQHCQLRLVTKVGGCDSNGDCMVQFENEVFGRAHMPIEGMASQWCGE